jgi:hypothetical protein
MYERNWNHRGIERSMKRQERKRATKVRKANGYKILTIDSEIKCYP